MKKLAEGDNYEVELIPMGEHTDDWGVDHSCLTSDEDSWDDEGQTVWNIFLTLRHENGDIDEILDIDIPVRHERLANIIFNTIETRVEITNRQRFQLD